jgi:hypothetical protein
MRQLKSGVYELLKKTPMRYLYHRLKALRGGSSQSDEADILVGLATACPKTFVEFGFHPTEYNCVGLAEIPGPSNLPDPYCPSVSKFDNSF